MSIINVGSSGGASGSGSGGGGKLLSKAESFIQWDASGSGKNLGGTFSWLGDPVGNNPMMVLVVDHSVHPTVEFHLWATMTQDSGIAAGNFEWSIWDATNGQMAMYRQEHLPASQWRGMRDYSQMHTHPLGVGAGTVEYRLHAKTTIASQDLRGGRADAGSYTADYMQTYGFEVRSAS